MKIRNGFVSNSSSSSFIIIGKDPLQIPKLHSAFGNVKRLDIPQTLGGTTDWNYETYRSNIDKLNWAALMCYIMEGPGSEKGNTNWTDMFCEVLQEDLGVEEIKINYMYNEDDEWTHDAFASNKIAYELNHGSNPYNSEESAKMFTDKETLRKFLWAPDSEIDIKYD